jgi:hypothetical protein
MPAEALEIFEWFGRAFAGWRYLLSASFRRRTHRRWKAEGLGKAIIESVAGGLSIVLTLLLLAELVGMLRWQ